MNKPFAIFTIALLALACGKEVDPTAMNSNPFDPQYNGENVFVFDTTYTQIITIPGGAIVNHVIAVHVKEELLPEGAAYAVRAVRVGTGEVTILNPDPPNSNSFKYQKVNPVVGVPECVRLSLFNNGSSARPEQICATL